MQCTKRFYQAQPDAFGALRSYLETYWSDKLALLKDAAELEIRRRRNQPTDPVSAIEQRQVAVEVDPVAGGVMVVNVTGQDITVGEFIEVVPGERLVFTWGFT